MAVSETCPRCDAEFDLGDDLRGRCVRCKECGEVFRVPGAAAGGAVLDVEPVGIPDRPPGREPAAPRRVKDELDAPKPRRARRRYDGGTDILLFLLVRFGIGLGILAVVAVPMICCTGVFVFGWFGL